MADSEIVLLDGRRLAVPAGRPLQESLAAAGAYGTAGAVAATGNGQVVDFMTPVPEGDVLTLVSADSPDGLRIIRHSAAHLMAAAVHTLYPTAKFVIGPAIDDGFYYDMELPRALAPEDLPAIEAKMRELAGKRLAVDRRETTSHQQGTNTVAGSSTPTPARPASRHQEPPERASKGFRPRSPARCP